MEINDIVNEKLKNMEISNIPDNIKRHLINIEKIIQKKESTLGDMAIKLKECDYDVKSIANELGLARSTFYKYNILQQYIMYSKGESRKNNPYSEIERLKQTIQEQKETIMLFKQRDCNMMLLEDKIEQQSKIIKEQKETIDRLKKMKILKFEK